ncbi:MAG: dicarboxylate/amino acid:cation symporter [Spirochaetaceae bacterium]|jgi:Na+/H+-dicarboxylate symporter|nr:dicarboxylate/amino acid:cation symporter [Spirochaetaceae bacterium]
MKVWVKLLVGAVLGLLLGVFLPAANQTAAGVFEFLAQLAISIGRYTAAAVLLFSLVVGIYELRQDGGFWRLLLRTLLIIAGTAVFVIGAGLFVASIFPPERIPILTVESAERLLLDTGRLVLDLFPANMLSIAGGEGVYLFPLCIFAFFLALGLSYDKNYTKQLMSLIDSLSRVFYHIAAFFSEILGLLIIILAAYWAIRYQNITDARVFRAILRLLLIFGILLAVVVMPLFLYLVKKYKTPWKVVYASLGSAFAAFFSGDINFCLPLFIQQSKENLGIRRRANALVTIIWTSFGRAGSAVVAVISLLVIIKSYSSLDLYKSDIFRIAFNTFLISFLLARNPGDGAFAALAALCGSYGHGIETGYLILKPVAFYLISIGAFLDIMLASFGCFAVTRICGFQTERSTKQFI